MDPYTAAALTTAQAGFEFGAELCKLLASPNGKILIDQAQKDRAQFDAAIKPIGEFFQNGIKAIDQAIKKATTQGG